MLDLVNVFLVVLKLIILPYGIIKKSLWSIPLLIFCSFFFPSKMFLIQSIDVSFMAYSNIYIMLFLSIALIRTNNAKIVIPSIIVPYLWFVIVAVIKSTSGDYFALKSIFLYLYILLTGLYSYVIISVNSVNIFSLFRTLFIGVCGVIVVFYLLHPEAIVDAGSRMRLSLGFGASSLALFVLPAFVVFLANYLVKKEALVYLVASFLVIFLTQSRSALGAMMVCIALAMIVYLFSNGSAKRVLAFTPVVIPMLILGVYFLSSHLFFEGANYSIESIRTTGRLLAWQNAIDKIMSSPFWGNGTGSSERWLYERGSHLAHPHNEYIRLVFEFGVFALVFLYFIGRGLKVSYRKWYIEKAQTIEVISMLLSVPILLLVMISDDVGLFSFFMCQIILIWIIGSKYTATEERASGQ
ncbi:MAG: O-antigen ligase family protein [Gammaproteobacteria bacterium]|nr:O-antigen ligase family protein [Gammaproteobacteria bacterium]